MKELNLLLQLPQDVSTRYRSVDMTVFASGSSFFTNSRVQKLKNSAKQNSWDSLPVFALECFFANETGIFFPEFSSAEFGALAYGFW